MGVPARGPRLQAPTSALLPSRPGLPAPGPTALPHAGHSCPCSRLHCAVPVGPGSLCGEVSVRVISVLTQDCWKLEPSRAAQPGPSRPCTTQVLSRTQELGRGRGPCGNKTNETPNLAAVWDCTPVSAHYCSKRGSYQPAPSPGPASLLGVGKVPEWGTAMGLPACVGPVYPAGPQPLPRPRSTCANLMPGGQ